MSLCVCVAGAGLVPGVAKSMLISDFYNDLEPESQRKKNNKNIYIPLILK